MTLRLGAEEAAALDAIADIEQTAVAEVIRLAIASAIEQRRTDPEFQRRLRHSVDRHRRLMDRMRPTT